MTDVLSPRLVHEVTPELGTSLGSLWLAVTRSGGSVGFLPDSPETEIRVTAGHALDEVRAGREHLIGIGSDVDLRGVVFLRPGSGPRTAHRADVVRLMVHPGVQGRGLGAALLGAAVARGTELGLEQLLLSVRGGTDLPAFYAKQGWTEVGVFPDALHLGGGERRDEHWFQLRLH